METVNALRVTKYAEAWKVRKIAFTNAQGKIALRKQGRERIKAVLGLTCLAETWRASFVRKSLFNSTVYAFVDGAQK